MGIFGLVTAERTAGKTTLAGTLPGRTLLLQAKLLETASKAAVRLGTKLGNTVEVREWSSMKELMELVEDRESFDHIYVDGISAMTELLEKQPDVAKIMARNVWDGYRLLGNYMTDALLKLKTVSIEEDVNVFCTMALDSKLDANGNITKLTPVAKGNVTLAQIQKICPVIVSLTLEFDEETGEQKRVMLTKADGVYPGRIDDILSEDNGGRMPANLTQLLEFIEQGEVPADLI